jgi:sugar porter (SP) family MFS transporter
MSQSRGTNPYLLRSTVVAALGGLLFGFDTAVIAGATRALTALYSLTPAMLGVTVSSALAGTVIGSAAAGGPADRYGRKASLQILAVLYVFTSIGCALAISWPMLLFFRALGGLAIGGSSVIGPMYIAEIAPASKRGRLVGMFQFNIVAGILIAYLSNYLIGTMGFADVEWRWKLGVPAIPAALFLLLLFRIPQSPRWLAARARLDEAERVLREIGEPDPAAELKDIAESIGAQRAEQRTPLFTARYRFPIFLAISIGVFNQFSGINAILYYLNDIFERAGFNKVSGDLQAVAIGATNLLFTIIAMSVIDRLGRKKLLLTGAAGTGICLAGVAAIFATGQNEEMLLWLLVAFIAFFAFSQGAVIWVYLSEVFPNVVRAKGQSLGSFTHWIMNFAISLVFPVLAAKSGAIPFGFFAAMMGVQVLVVWRFYPETSGITLEEMQKRMEASQAGD